MAKSAASRAAVTVLVFFGVTAASVVPSIWLAGTISCWGVEVKDALDPARYCGFGGLAGFLVAPAVGLLLAIIYVVWDAWPLRLAWPTKLLTIVGKVLATAGAVVIAALASIGFFVGEALECSGMSIGSMSCDVSGLGVAVWLVVSLVFLVGAAWFVRYVWIGHAPDGAYVAVTFVGSAALLGVLAFAALEADSSPVMMETTTYATTTQPKAATTLPVAPGTTVTTTSVIAPSLVVYDPAPETPIATATYTFVGMTDPGCTVTAAGRYAAEVREDGMWSIDLVLRPGRNTATFVAEDPAGAQTTVRVPVFYVPSDPDTTPLIGLVHMSVPDPADPVGATPSRVLNYDVEPPRLEDLWVLGGWMVDYQADEPEWATGLLATTRPSDDWPTPGAHFVVLDLLIDRVGDGRPIWLVRDAVAIGELREGEWVQACRERGASVDTAWPAVGHVGGEPVESDVGPEVLVISAWRIDLATGRLMAVDPASVLCVPETG